MDKIMEKLELTLVIATGLVLLVALLTAQGCTSVPKLTDGQAVVNETQVEGIDLSIPIPGLDNVNVVQLRFGFIQNKLYKGNNVPYYSDSDYEDISIIKGMGTVKRTLKVGK